MNGKNSLITVQEIREICHVEKEQRFINAGWLKRSYTYHRYVSAWITFFFLNLLPNVKPNYVSFLMILTGFSGCIFLAFPDLSTQLAACFLLYLSFLFDKVDGDIARFRQEFSQFGKFLDEIYHLFPQTFIFLSLGISLRNGPLGNVAMWIGVVGLASAMFNRLAPKFVSMLASDQRADVMPDNHNRNQPIELTKFVMDLAITLVRFDSILLLIFLSTIIDFLVSNYHHEISIASMVLLVLVFINIARQIVIMRSAFNRLS